MTPPPPYSDGPPSSLHQSASTEGIPIAPSLGPVLQAAHMPQRSTLIDRRVLHITAIAVLVAVAAAYIAQWLTALIGLCTNLAFYGRWSTAFVSPAGHHLGGWVIAVPVLGGLIVGIMARYGSQAIRGHGIPEAMEQVLLNESRIPPRITFLKPTSSAIAIGTGGPFGAEGPIIATGGALGSFIGQVLHVTASERKTLLAAGAAAGMAAVFGSPLSAVVLAVELLLFELRARSLVPVALATVTATAVRYALVGSAPVFPMPQAIPPGAAAIAGYAVIGALIGLASVIITRAVYDIEDAFAKLPIHWMWWPAVGGLAVGVVGYYAPLTLGVGYSNIEAIVNGHFAANALLFLCVMKFLSWSIALGSGTSGGTLAPLFTIGGALGGLLGMLAAYLMPSLGIDPRIAGLVGMAAMFSGASRALLASIIFAFETTRQPLGLLPLIGGCTAAYVVSCLMMRHTIMTEKIARRGVRVPSEYAADYLDQVLVRDACTRGVVSLRAGDTVEQTLKWLLSGLAEAQHQGFPVLDEQGQLCGVLTRRSLFNASEKTDATLHSLIRQVPIAIGEQHTLREAADLMVQADIGRLIVLSQEAPHRMVGILTRGDLLAAHSRRLKEMHHVSRHLSFGRQTVQS